MKTVLEYAFTLCSFPKQKAAFVRPFSTKAIANELQIYFGQYYLFQTRGVPNNPAPDRRFFKNPIPAGFVLNIRPSTGFS